MSSPVTELKLFSWAEISHSPGELSCSLDAAPSQLAPTLRRDGLPPVLAVCISGSSVFSGHRPYFTNYSFSSLCHYTSVCQLTNACRRDFLPTATPYTEIPFCFLFNSYPLLCVTWEVSAFLLFLILQHTLGWHPGVWLLCPIIYLVSCMPSVLLVADSCFRLSHSGLPLGVCL